MKIPKHLLPDPASARHLLLRAAAPLPLGPLARDPQSIRSFQHRPHTLVEALKRCLRDYAAAGPTVRLLPLLLLAARLGIPAPSLVPAAVRRLTRFETLLERAKTVRQKDFCREQIRALHALIQSLTTGIPPEQPVDAVAFGCRAAFPAAWAVRDVLFPLGIPYGLVPEPDKDLDESISQTAHMRLHLALVVSSAITLPDLQQRLRQARDARRRKCIRSALLLCVLHKVSVPTEFSPYLPMAFADLSPQDRAFLKKIIS